VIETDRINNMKGIVANKYIPEVIVAVIAQVSNNTFAKAAKNRIDLINRLIPTITSVIPM
jgi:hypothetical protein